MKNKIMFGGRMKRCSKTALFCTVTALLLSSPSVLSQAITSSKLQWVLQRLAAQEAILDQQQLELQAQRDELEDLRTKLLVATNSSMSVLHSESVFAAGKASTTPIPLQGDPVNEAERGLEFSGYGIVNYIKRDWETDEFAKDSVDTERFILEMEYRFDDDWMAKAEIEYEHGGTGVELDFDSQEEFGEFEVDVNKGGEVLIEELYVAYQYEPWLNAKFGRFYVPIGRTNTNHRPQEYFSVARSDADAAMIPQLWHENGIAVFGTIAVGDWGRLNYEAQLVNGLDSTGFSSRNWIAGGHQKRAEEARAEELALVGRLDYHMNEDLQIGASYYGGNTTGNRPKNDLDEDAYVDLVEFDGQWTPGDFIVRGQYMWGRLQNSHLVTEANRNLSNNLGVKRTPVGSEAQSWFVEAGYDMFGSRPQSLILFGRYDDYDSMFATEGLVFDNPRWHRESWTVGVNYLPIPNVIFKAEYNARELDLDANNKEDTIAVGVGFTY